ncbi:ribonuclease HI family protein [bacterium]|nr:ribonuclease HI family protein [bacterium]
MSKVIIYTDGASKGNPGDAGIGVVISSPEGEVLREIGEYIGKTTNNVAEYSALIRGLKEAADLGATHIEISTDSELMARQLTGVYKVKSPNLQPLYAEAVGLIRHFASVSISHVVRELNSRADELANLGVKNRSKPRQKRVDAAARSGGKSNQRELEF